jgi:pyridoxal phosphate enzyme (YggS family)
VDKVEALRALGLEWHFIGPLQSNKTRPVANAFDWVHGIDRLKIAERLSAQRGGICRRSRSASRSTSAARTARAAWRRPRCVALAHAVAALPRLRLRGLMCIPEPSADEAVLRARFAVLRGLYDELRAAGLALDTLSMGMSHDLEPAIAEGASIVRVGTDLRRACPARITA